MMWRSRLVMILKKVKLVGGAILVGDKGWRITTTYKGKTYISPWSVSILNRSLSHARLIMCNNNPAPPSSETALKYLAKFCAHH